MTKIYQFQYEVTDLDSLDDERLMVVQAAIDATSHSYAPYSRFHVGCGILLEDGSVIKGSNMENAAYSAAICAERTAISTLHASGISHQVCKIAIAYQSDHTTSDKLLSPCGECRQVIAETAMRQEQPIEIILYTNDYYIVIIYSHEHLLPFSFDKNNLI